MREHQVPSDYNYIGVFLTLGCNYDCFYCLNHHGKFISKRKIMSVHEWASGLSSLKITGDLPVTLQGGEPTLYPNFYELISKIPSTINIDLLTNLTFKIEEFIAKVDPRRMTRSAPYPSIRVSYHPSEVDLDVIYKKTKKLSDLGYSIGVYGIEHPSFVEKNRRARELFLNNGIIFKTKEFLGYERGILFGNYVDPKATDGIRKTRECYVNELLIDPSGNVFRCHRDLYSNQFSIGNILDNQITLEDKPRLCDRYGECHPCDVKVKTNRFQVFGHTSAQISEGVFRFPSTDGQSISTL